MSVKDGSLTASSMKALKTLVEGALTAGRIDLVVDEETP